MKVLPLAAVACLAWTSSVMAWEFADPAAPPFPLEPTVAVDANGDVVVNGANTRKLDGIAGTTLWSVVPAGAHMALTATGDVARAVSAGGCLGADLLDGADGSPVWTYVDPVACGLGTIGIPRVAVDPSGDVVVASFAELPAYVIHVVKVDGATGGFEWRTSWTASRRDLTLAVDAAGDVVVLEQLTNAVKLVGATGVELWRVDPAPLVPSDFDLDPTNAVYLALHGFAAVTIEKLDAAGATTWTSVIAESSNLTPVIEVGDGVVVGKTAGDGIGLVVKLDAGTGDELWRTGFGEVSDPGTSIRDVAFDSMGDVLVTGALPRRRTERDMLVAKLTGSTGSIVWSTLLSGIVGTIEGPGFGGDIGLSVTADAVGGAVAVGSIRNTSTLHDEDVAVVKIDGTSGRSTANLPCGGTVCTPCEVCVAGACVSQARTDCELPLGETGSLLKIDHDAGAGLSRILWQWSDSDGIADGDVGDPRLTTDYTLCVYDEMGGTTRLVWDRDLPAMRACKGRPCWRESAKGGPVQFGYVEKTSPVTGNTVVKGVLRAGDPARAQLKVKGNGAGLALPSLGLTTPVRVELRSSTGSCRAATYDADVTVNTGTSFVARGGP